jgi:hypothetical protein
MRINSHWVFTVVLPLLLGSFTVGTSAALAADNVELEYRVKAAFLFNFARYTQWPSSNPPFNFCVTGSDEMLLAVREAIADKTLRGQAPRVEHLNAKQDASRCDVLYLGDKTDAEFARQLNGPGAPPVLLVGEGRAFPQDFGMVGFHLANGRLRFAINPALIRKAGLQMSSQLLGLADIVGSEH